MIRTVFLIATCSLVNLFTICYSHVPNNVVTIDEFEPVEGSESYKFDFTGIEHAKYNRTSAVLNGTFEIREWPDDMAISGVVLQETNNGYVESGAGKVEDALFCALMKTDLIIVPQFKKCSGFPDDCPGPIGVYNLINYLPDESKLPPNLPKGNYRLEMTLHRHGDPSVVYGRSSVKFNIRNNS